MKRFDKQGVGSPVQQKNNFDNIDINGGLDGAGGGGGGDAFEQAKAASEAAAAKATADAAAAAGGDGGAGGNADGDGGTGGDGGVQHTPEQVSELAAHSGTGYDAEGNMLDATGTVVKTKAELEAGEGDGDGYSLNETGDLVDAEGNVVVTKDNIVRDEKTGDVILPETPLVEMIQTGLQEKFGVDLVGEDGKPMVFADTDEGMAAMTEAIIERVGNTNQDNWVKQNPRLEKYANHVKAGGTDANFFSANSVWRSATLPDADDKSDEAVAIRKDTITKNFLNNFGFDAATPEKKIVIAKRARMFVEAIEDGDALTSEATESLGSLQAEEQAFEDARDSANLNAIQKQQDANTQLWRDIGTTVKTGKLGDLTIPDADRQKFLDYLSKDVTGQGESQEAVDRAKEDLSLTLQLSYFRYKGFDLAQLVKLKATQSKGVTLRSRGARRVSVVNNRQQNGSINKSGNISDISVNTL
ncbi:MAG: hypothetical protein COA82_03660 [Alkaliphilus sp.]|nr:MAG: hypothetical protein COA82_03660 [Alkaliphilus sp.]